MENPKQICYVCDQEGEEEHITENDGKVHVFFIHKKESGAGRPKRCDGGYEETEAEFMHALEEGDESDQKLKLIDNSKRVAKGYSRIALEATTEVFVKMYMHTCQRCNHNWITKEQLPTACNKCTSRTWNMAK